MLVETTVVPAGSEIKATLKAVSALVSALPAEVSVAPRVVSVVGVAELNAVVAELKLFREERTEAAMAEVGAPFV